jgi:hypothetical protein
MMRTRVGAGALALGLTIVLSAGGAQGSAGGKRGCDSINLGGPKIFFKQNMNCKSAKKKARQVYRSRGQNEPRKFDCESASNFEEGGSCQHVSKNKAFGWHPADKRKAAKRERCGRYNSTSNFDKARVTAIRGVECDEALKVARRFDHKGDAKAPWECFLAHGGGRALFSCGYGGTSGDVRDFPHALVARGVGPRGS